MVSNKSVGSFDSEMNWPIYLFDTIFWEREHLRSDSSNDPKISYLLPPFKKQWPTSDLSTFSTWNLKNKNTPPPPKGVPSIPKPAPSEANANRSPSCPGGIPLPGTLSTKSSSPQAVQKPVKFARASGDWTSPSEISGPSGENSCQTLCFFFE